MAGGCVTRCPWTCIAPEKLPPSLRADVSSWRRLRRVVYVVSFKNSTEQLVCERPLRHDRVLGVVVRDTGQGAGSVVRWYTFVLQVREKKCNFSSFRPSEVRVVELARDSRVRLPDSPVFAVVAVGGKRGWVAAGRGSVVEERWRGFQNLFCFYCSDQSTPCGGDNSFSENLREFDENDSVRPPPSRLLIALFLPLREARGRERERLTSPRQSRYVVSPTPRLLSLCIFSAEGQKSVRGRPCVYPARNVTF